MYRANADVARLALHCAAQRRNGPAPDLLLTSRRSVSAHNNPEAHLDVVGEAIGERLIRVISDVSCEASFRDAAREEIEVLNEHHFAADIRRELAEDLGLSIDGDAFPTFESALADDFLRWLGVTPQAVEWMRAKILGTRLSVRCPRFHRTRTR
jgi:hypothetical protein